MRVLNYLELEGPLERSGIGTATDHQRRALAGESDHSGGPDIEVSTDPWGGSLRSVPRRLIRERSPTVEYDIAHCNGIGPGSLAVARDALRTDTPLVLHAHVTREDFRDSFRWSNALSGPLGSYLKWFYSQADLVLCPSEQTRHHLEAYPVSAPIEPITNGVDHRSLEGVPSRRESARNRFDIEGLVAFAVGNVFERKGLRTFCRLADRTPYGFVWFGPYDRGPQASPPVRRLTRDPPSDVRFTGWIEDKRDAFAAGDVFVFPTRAENQGIAVLEAMACGKPVVLRDIPVFREFYTHGVDCLLCSTEDDFCEALETLAANPDRRQELGENARETAAEHSLERVRKRLLEVYERLVT